MYSLRRSKFAEFFGKLLQTLTLAHITLRINLANFIQKEGDTMLDNTTFAEAFEFAGYIVGIFSLMRICSGGRSIVTMRRNVMH